MDNIISNDSEYFQEMKAPEKEKLKMPFNEKNFIYRWIDNDKFDGLKQYIELPQIEDTSKTRKIDYLVKTAECEYTKRKHRDDNGRLLPKKDRLNIAYVKVIFIVIDLNVYSIICENNDYNVLRTMKLIGHNNIEANNDVIISPGMFDWLFYKKLKFEGELSDNLKLDNITGFKGNIVDEHDIFEGSSDQTVDLIITKAFISNGYPVRNMKIIITSDEGQLFFLLDEHSNVRIGRDSYINILFNNQEDSITIPIYLYSFIIPEISYLYGCVSDKFNKNDKSIFSYEVGKDVIESISRKNNMNLIVRHKVMNKRNAGRSSVRLTGHRSKSKYY